MHQSTMFAARGLLTACGALATLSAQTPLLANIGEALPDGLGQVVAVADFDGDGISDLLTTTGAFLNFAGFFVPGPTLPAAVQTGVGVRSLVVADFDGDGRADVIVARPNTGGSGLTMLQAAVGATAFTSTPITLGGFGAFGSLAAADFDADGDVDVIAAATDANVPRWALMLNDGSGGWSLAGPGQWPVQPFAADWLGAGDFDGDGLIDIYAARGGAPLWRRNLGGGSFSSNLGGAVAMAADIGAVGDFDGDGFDDVLLYDVSGSQTLQNGSSNGPVPTGFASTPALAAPPVVADIDGDGYDDLIRANVAFRGMTEADLVVQLGGPSGLAVVKPLGTAFYAYGPELPLGPLRPYPGVAVFDVEGDADLDMVFAPGAQTPLMMLNGGTSPPTLISSALPPDLRSLMAPPRDVDGDGDIDLVRSRAHNNNIVLEVFVNDGRGLFSWPPQPAGSYPGAIPGPGRWGDVDNDGDDDLVVFNLFPVPTLRVLRNDGNGVFTTGATIPGVNQPASVAIADFNGDSVPDLVLGRSLAVGPGVVYQTPVLFAGMAVQGGNVAYGAPVPFGVAELVTDLVVFDAEPDGDLDLLCAVSGIAPGGGPARIYENDGTGTFTALPQFANTTADYVAVGDLDGDGLEDLVLGDETWLRQGANYVQVGTHPAPRSEYSLADLDEDGDLDLVDRSGQWYPGTGTGTFSPPVSFVPYSSTTPWLSGSGRVPMDLDADGDLDMLGPSHRAPGHMSIYSNLIRHVAPRNLALAGGVLTVGIHGRVGDPWFLAVSLPSTGAIPLAPFGTLFLNPNAMIVLTSGTIPTGGRSDTGVALPAAGAGFTISWQALVGAPLKMTNCFDTRIAF